jgi:hypothetical protein
VKPPVPAKWDGVTWLSLWVVVGRMGTPTPTLSGLVEGGMLSGPPILAPPRSLRHHPFSVAGRVFVKLRGVGHAGFWGVGFRVRGLGLGFWGLGLGFGVWGLGWFRVVSGLGSRV